MSSSRTSRAATLGPSTPARSDVRSSVNSSTRSSNSISKSTSSSHSLTSDIAARALAASQEANKGSTVKAFTVLSKTPRQTKITSNVNLKVKKNVTLVKREPVDYTEDTSSVSSGSRLSSVSFKTEQSDDYKTLNPSKASGTRLVPTEKKDEITETKEEETRISCLTSPNFKEDISFVAKRLVNTKHCIIITGAGVSVSAGIPDFRSADGLYNLVKKRYPDVVVKGKDMFDAILFQNPKDTKIFCTFMAELRMLVSKAKITDTHRFIKKMDDEGKLLRCYTQNIDSIEKRLGLSSDLAQQKSLKVVQLHGDLLNVICTMCKTKYPFEEEILEIISDGDIPECPACEEKQVFRSAQGKRPITTGILRPDIVLYNEPHENGEIIGMIADKDINKGPGVVIVIGTSLKVHGIRQLVRDTARSVHSRKNGIMVLVNKTKLGKEWDSVFDYQFIDSSDDVIVELENEFNNLSKLKEQQRLERIRRSELKNAVNNIESSISSISSISSSSSSRRSSLSQVSIDSTNSSTRTRRSSRISIL